MQYKKYKGFLENFSFDIISLDPSKMGKNICKFSLLRIFSGPAYFCD
jgi:hypothetical protein